MIWEINEWNQNQICLAMKPRSLVRKITSLFKETGHFDIFLKRELNSPNPKADLYFMSSYFCCSTSVL